MTTSEQRIKTVCELLEEIGLSDRSGSILYSGNETLTKGLVYFLRSNPGGHKDQLGHSDTVQTQLLKDKKKFNEYFDGEWLNKYTKTPDLPGQHEHQQNIQSLFTATNEAFV